jgi:predicted dehydrogenase
MEKIRLALVGCGGMGTRHLYGLSELAQTPFNNIELAALCDIKQENLDMAAAEAEKLLGTRPHTYTDLAEMARQESDLAAVDVVTDPSVHHGIVCQALDLGLHVMVEKPMAITVGTCRMMLDAARRNGRLLSVAENYRRDPSARLVRHLLDSGAIGTPYMALFHSISGGNRIMITPWRHLKDKGGPLLDMGVHFTDLVRYQLGDIAEVYGDVRLVEPVRRKADAIGDQYAFYQQRHKAMDAQVPATAEDSSLAVFRMASGVTVSWVVTIGGHGHGGTQQILGEKGSIEGYGSRGSSTRLRRSGEEPIEYDQLIRDTSGFELEPLAAHFFPNITTVGDGAVDWKLIALEQYELAEAILNGRALEVDGTQGLKDVAAVYAMFEAARVGRSVTMEEVESGAVYAYQREIDEALGLPSIF